MTGLLILLALLVVVSTLLTITVGGYCDLAAENRRLRTELAGRRHPAYRSLTLFTGGTDGGAA